MMRFLILGCNGMAGHMISLYLQEQGYDVTGFARQKSKLVNTVCGDAQDLPFLRKVIQDGNYDIIVNCIGILNQDAENNKYRAVYMNSLLPHALADMTADMVTKIIHISTDCVFSGKQGGYVENAVKDGETFYDRTKALGELIDDKNITLRQSIVGPDMNPNGIGLLNWFMKQSGTINGFTKAIWTGQTTLQLVKTVEAVAKVPNVHGLFNMVPEHSITKFELLKLFNKYLRNDEIEIVPVEQLVADKSLIRTNFDVDYTIPDYEKMIFDMAIWMKEHKELYSHYSL